MNEKGLWIAIDGIDAVGKTTQVKAVAEKLRGSGINNVTEVAEFSSFPSGRVISEILTRQRFYALDPKKRTPLADTTFLITDMLAQYETQIAPTIFNGGLAISDRGNVSLIAYQALRIESNENSLRDVDSFYWVNNLAQQCFIAPDITILLTLSEQEMIRRIAARGEQIPNGHELDFLRKTKDAINKAIKVSSSKVVEIDGSFPKEEVTRQIIIEINKRYKIK